MVNKNKKGFTLVELLAVIVILAIILVIAVPQIMFTIEESRNGAFASSAKLIASSAETLKLTNDILGIEKTITCPDVAEYNSEDYQSCSITFDEGEAHVTLAGKGKFAGKYVCAGTRTNAVVTEEECPVPPVSFSTDDWKTIVAAVESGNYPYTEGNTKTVDLGTLGTHTLRVANTTPCSEVSVTSQSACGFVLEFADIITTHNMNPSGEYNGKTYSHGWSKDGWPASQMYKYVNETIYNAIPEDLRNGIIDTTVVSSHGNEDSDNFISTDKLYLLSPEEVYGTSFTNSTDESRGTSRQLDWYSENGDAIKKIGNTALSWWLRSAYSNDNYAFYTANSNGDWEGINAASAYGVSPAFRIG